MPKASAAVPKAVAPAPATVPKAAAAVPKASSAAVPKAVAPVAHERSLVMNLSTVWIANDIPIVKRSDKGVEPCLPWFHCDVLV